MEVPAVEITVSGMQTPFDAAEWFGDAPAAQIEWFRSVGYRACCAVLGGEDFEIVVDAEAAEAWIREHRPDCRQRTRSGEGE